jgi:O-antigen polymerase
VLPVIAILLIIIVLSGAVWLRGGKRHKAIWLMMFPIVLHTQTEYPLYHSATHLFLLAIFLSSIRLFKKRQVHVSVGAPFKMLAVVLSLLVSVFMVTNLQAVSKVMKYAETADISVFSEIINPIAQQRILNAGTGIAIVRAGDPEGMPTAQKILLKESMLRPSEGISTYLYHAYRLQEMEKDMDALLQESLYLYPESHFFNQYKKKVKSD